MCKSEDCRAECSDQKYILKASYSHILTWTSYEIKGNGIVTSIRLFYKQIFVTTKGETYDQGNLFVGV